LIVFVVAVVAVGLIRNDPADKGLEPVGMVKSLDYDPSATKGSFSTSRILAHLGILYFLFGATYVIYGTFTPSYLASAGLTAIALFVSAFLPKPSPQD
jgi:predicted Co/Zn/Cd cation transporter (cation efflux family)